MFQVSIPGMNHDASEGSVPTIVIESLAAIGTARSGTRSVTAMGDTMPLPAENIRAHLAVC